MVSSRKRLDCGGGGEAICPGWPHIEPHAVQEANLIVE